MSDEQGIGDLRMEEQKLRTTNEERRDFILPWRFWRPHTPQEP
jgi:hypothetical protein